MRRIRATIQHLSPLTNNFQTHFWGTNYEIETVNWHLVIRYMIRRVLRLPILRRVLRESVSNAALENARSAHAGNGSVQRIIRAAWESWGHFVFSALKNWKAGRSSLTVSKNVKSSCSSEPSLFFSKRTRLLCPKFTSSNIASIGSSTPLWLSTEEGAFLLTAGLSANTSGIEVSRASITRFASKDSLVVNTDHESLSGFNRVAARKTGANSLNRRSFAKIASK